MSENITHVTDGTFDDDVLKHDGPVLVDFWAEWCGPCRMIAPLLDRVAAEFDGKLKIAKMDIDANPDTPARYNVRGIPTLLIFKDGNVAGTKVGAMSGSQLNEFIESTI